MRTIRLFGHYVRLQILLLVTLEFLIFMGSLYGGAFIRFGGDSSTEMMVGWLLPRAIVFALVMVCSAGAMGLYQPNQREWIVGTMLRISMAFLLGGIAMAVYFYAFPDLYTGRGVLALAIAISFIGTGSLRALSFSSVGQDLFRRRVLVLGTGTKASSILDMRRRSDWRNLSIIGFVPIQGELSKVDSIKILKIDESLVEFAIKREIDQIVVALDDCRNSLPIVDLLECKMNGIHVIDLFTFFEHEFGKIRLDLLQPSHLIFSEGFVRNTSYSYIKRVFDIIVSLLLLVATWPIMLITALAILLESQGKGSVLYRQVRVGQEGKLFNIMKFRSMHTDAEQDKPRWAEKNDSRVTRVGRIIRKYRIDELPQIFNVLHGHMGFVGPRPERPEFVEQLKETIPLYTERHRVKPGISGWAQLCYPYGSSEKDAKEKLQYDLYYVKNSSIFLDLIILLQTAEVVLFSRGAR